MGIATLLACVGAPPIASQNCVDPTPTEPQWWHAEVEGNHMRFPEPPRLSSELAFSDWAGIYRLLMVTTAGTETRDTFVARLVLRKPSTAAQSVVLIGSTDSTFDVPYGSLAYPTYSDTDSLPGVEVRYDRQWGRLTLVLGNAGFGWTDSGILLDAFDVRPTGFRGRWVDGGLAVLLDAQGKSLGHPQGYFCVDRVSPH